MKNLRLSRMRAGCSLQQICYVIAHSLQISEVRPRTSRNGTRFAEHPLRLETGQLFEICGGQGFEVECHEGAVWITQSNDSLDVVLTADESFVLEKSGLAIVSACGGQPRSPSSSIDQRPPYR
jgi:hypothetical protein